MKKEKKSKSEAINAFLGGLLAVFTVMGTPLLVVFVAVIIMVGIVTFAKTGSSMALVVAMLSLVIGPIIVYGFYRFSYWLPGWLDRRKEARK